MNKVVAISMGLILLILTLWLQTSSIPIVKHVIEDIQNVSYDLQLRTARFVHRKDLDTKVAIVNIDDNSILAEGRWPWPRNKMANLIMKIQDHGAAVIALDMFFSEEQTNIANTVLEKLKKEELAIPHVQSIFEQIIPSFDDDTKLSKAFSGGDSIVGFAFLNTEQKAGVISNPLLVLSPREKQMDLFHAKGFLGTNEIIAEGVTGMGSLNFSADEDGVIRKVRLITEYDGGVYPSLALEATRTYLLTNTFKLITADYSGRLHLEKIQVGNRFIPTNGKSQVIVPYQGPSFTFPYYSSTDVLNDNVPEGIFDDKIVFIGATATGLGELKSTAVDKAFPGVEVHATVADGILKNQFWSKPAWSLGAEVFLTALIGLITCFLYPFLGPKTLIVLILTLPTVLIFANNEVLIDSGLVLSVFFPVNLSVIMGVLNLTYGYVTETIRKNELKNIFGQYVPEGHIDEMLQSEGEYGLDGESREMSILFSDIRGFTTISEHMSAVELKELLNSLFTPLTEAIFNNKGTIDKYIGDAIMAFWGAPLKDEEHAEHAIAAALDMLQALIDLKDEIEEHHWPKIEIGIGVNRGNVIVGDMGSKYRRNYTVLGDEVNLASRVEGLTKFYGVKIIATGEAKRDQTRFIFRKLDRVMVVGKEVPADLYEVVGFAKDASHELIQEIKNSDAALFNYYKQNWDKALADFQDLLSNKPDSKFYKLYIERIKAFKENPPPEDWDGVYVHKSK